MGQHQKTFAACRSKHLFQSKGLTDKRQMKIVYLSCAALVVSAGVSVWTGVEEFLKIKIVYLFYKTSFLPFFSFFSV